MITRFITGVLSLSVLALLLTTVAQYTEPARLEAAAKKKQQKKAVVQKQGKKVKKGKKGKGVVQQPKKKGHAVVPSPTPTPVPTPTPTPEIIVSTPSPSPSPTPVSTQATMTPVILFSDDFEKGTLTQWGGQGGRSAVANGADIVTESDTAVLHNTGAYMEALARRSRDWKNYTATFKLKITKDPARVTFLEAMGRHYVLTIHQTGNTMELRRENFIAGTQPTELTLTLPQSIDFSTWHRVTIAVDQHATTNLRFTIDDVTVTSHDPTRFAYGTIGFSTTPGTGEFYVDDLVVTALAEQAAATP